MEKERKINLDQPKSKTTITEGIMGTEAALEYLIKRFPLDMRLIDIIEIIKKDPSDFKKVK
jgi:hypothetical protein